MLRAEDKSITMASNCRSFEFTAAIRGFHIYQKVWQPELNDTLVCIHERGNEFDAFSIKTVRADDNAIVGHLPREISRPTKYLLDGGAIVKAIIKCSYYRRSLLFQGGLEIPCMVTVSMPGTIRNHLYREFVTDLYCEPEHEVIIGNFLSPTEQAPIERPQKRKKIVSVPEKKKIRSNDIRLLLNARKKATRIKIKAKK